MRRSVIGALPVLAAACALAPSAHAALWLSLDQAVATPDETVRAGALGMEVRRSWHWRTLRGPDPGTAIVQISNASLRVRSGLDPIKDMGKRTFVLTFVPLGSFGSAKRPHLECSDFLSRADPSRPRGHAVARSSFCSLGGRCFSIRLEYGSERVPSATLAAVNRILRTVRASPVRR